MTDEPIKKKIGDFLWTIMQGRVQCGKYFKNIPGLEERQFCKCGEVKTIEHILLQCKENGQKIIWKMAKEIWKMTSLESSKWLKLTAGLVKGLGAIQRIEKEKTNDKERETENS
jgi:hypothetical protein